MCLGAPAKVIAIDDLMATVEVAGERRDVALVLLDEPVEPGDHVLLHLGFAVRRIGAEDVEETLAAFEMIQRGVEEAAEI